MWTNIKKTVGKRNSRTRVLIGSSSFTLNCNSNCSSAPPPATENWLHQFKCELFNFTTNEQEEEEDFAIDKQTPSAPLDGLRNINDISHIEDTSDFCSGWLAGWGVATVTSPLNWCLWGENLQWPRDNQIIGPITTTPGSCALLDCCWSHWTTQRREDCSGRD